MERTYRKPTPQQEKTLEEARMLKQRSIEGEKDLLSKISTQAAAQSERDAKASERLRASVPEAAREGEAYKYSGHKKGGAIKASGTKKMADGGLADVARAMESYNSLPWQVRNAPKPGSSVGDITGFMGKWATRAAPGLISKLPPEAVAVGQRIVNKLGSLKPPARTLGSGMKQGGAVNKSEKSGSGKVSASRRADGIAQRGKTKGRML